MIIKKGSILDINHERKGNFTGKLISDFSTEEDEWVSIILITGYTTKSLSENDGIKGEEILCKISLCTSSSIIKLYFLLSFYIILVI